MTPGRFGAAKKTIGIFLVPEGTRLRAASLCFASPPVPVAERKSCSTRAGTMPISRGFKETLRAPRFSCEEEEEERQRGRKALWPAAAPEEPPREPGAEGGERILPGAEWGEGIPWLQGEEGDEPSPRLCSAAPPAPLWGGRALLCLGFGGINGKLSRCFHPRHSVLEASASSPAPSNILGVPLTLLRVSGHFEPCRPRSPKDFKTAEKVVRNVVNESLLGHNPHPHKDPVSPFTMAA